MNRIFNKLIPFVLLTAVLGFSFSACNQEDDVNEIFASGQTWHWSSSYDTSNWEDDNKVTETLSTSDKQYINSSERQGVFIIQFSDDGTVEGKGESFNFSGTWSANGKDNSININVKADRTPNAGSRDAKFFSEITSARYYRGDSRLIKLFEGNKKHFIQFYQVGFRN